MLQELPERAEGVGPGEHAGHCTAGELAVLEAAAGRGPGVEVEGLGGGVTSEGGLAEGGGAHLLVGPAGL